MIITKIDVKIANKTLLLLIRIFKMVVREISHLGEFVLVLYLHRKAAKALKQRVILKTKVVEFVWKAMR